MLLSRIVQRYQSIINPAFESDEDYASIRKVKFLNFTCLVSSIIGIIGTIILIIQEKYTVAPFNLLWSLILLGIIYFNRKGKIFLTRYVFLILWLIYALTGIYFLENEAFREYYFLITILLIFILFDSFWFNLISFVILFSLFIAPVDLVEFTNRALRYGALFLITSFVKQLIFEVEKVLEIKHREALEYEIQKAEDEQRFIKADLEHKNQEIIGFAVQITQKNEFIESLKERLSEIKKELNNPAELKRLEEIILANETITKDRKQFEAHVQYIHEGFFSRLNELFPDISSGEKRLAALLRMELSSKEISTVLNISPKSVDMSRYRLRKKMNLDGKDNLTEVLKLI